MTTRSRSSEEVLEYYMDSMGEVLGTAFWHLNQKILEVHLVWEQYKQLYGESEETVRTLNETAGLFFMVVQDSLWDSVIQGICRLTDPAQMSGRQNLSIRALSALIANEGLRREVAGLCEEALFKAQFARDHRNKRIAHQDKNHLYDREAQPLGGVSRKLIKEMLGAITAVMNAINVHYCDTTMFYDDISSGGDAAWLVYKLKS